MKPDVFSYRSTAMMSGMQTTANTVALMAPGGSEFNDAPLLRSPFFMACCQLRAACQVNQFAGGQRFGRKLINLLSD